MVREVCPSLTWLSVMLSQHIDMEVLQIDLPLTNGPAAELTFLRVC
jgi:hypothetical protein